MVSKSVEKPVLKTYLASTQVYASKDRIRDLTVVVIRRLERAHPVGGLNLEPRA